MIRITVVRDEETRTLDLAVGLDGHTIRAIDPEAPDTADAAYVAADADELCSQLNRDGWEWQGYDDPTDEERARDLPECAVCAVGEVTPISPATRVLARTDESGRTEEIHMCSVCARELSPEDAATCEIIDEAMDREEETSREALLEYGGFIAARPPAPESETILERQIRVAIPVLPPEGHEAPYLVYLIDGVCLVLIDGAIYGEATDALQMRN